MANDIKLKNEAGNFDILFEKGDLAPEDGLGTAIYLSLGTNRRASSSQIGPSEQRSGWLGNLVSDFANRELGSYLYLAEQRRLTQDTLNENVDSATKSLDWLIKDKAAQRVEISGRIVPLFGVELKITTTVNNDKTDFYFPLWEATGNG